MRARNIAIGAIAAVLLLGAGLLLAAKPIAGAAIRQALAAQGFDEPQAHVRALSLNHIVVSDIAAGPETARDLQIDQMRAEFDAAALWRARRVQSIVIDGGRVRVSIDEAGEVTAPGAAQRTGAGGGGPLPFDRLEIADLALIVATPEGEARGTLDARYDSAGDGSARLGLEAQRAGVGAVRLDNARLALALDLAASGAAQLRGDLTGDVSTAFGAVADAAIAIDGEGGDWRAAAAGDWRAFAGAAELVLDTARLDLAGAPAAAQFNQYANLIGGAVSVADLSGALRLSVEDGAVFVEMGAQPLTLAADTGARLTVDASLGEPVFLHDAGRTALAAVLSLRGGEVAAGAQIDIEKTAAGWRFDIPLQIDALRATPLTLRSASAVLRGSVAGARTAFETTVRGDVLSASLGRFTVSDAPVAMTLIGDIDLDARRMTLSLPAGNCAAIDRMAIKIARQDADASLREARLCAGAGPLAIINVADAVTTDFSGEITAQNARYRLGQTVMRGRPTAFNLNGRYLPAQNHTVATGAASGGSVVLNELLRFDSMNGTVRFELKEDALSVAATAAQARITEVVGEAGSAKLAPILMTGALRLQDDIARFDYSAATPGGAQLGEGAGRHNIKTATGEAAFDFRRLEFNPGGLQPDALAPVLKGIIGETVGAADGAAQFSWSKAGVKSSADIQLDAVTFRGPGLTVAQTRGVDGAIALSSLWPPATDGPQTVNVAGVDFGALQLRDGEIVFELPGDETLIVDRAIFPWFGGQIGVRDARAAFDGGNATAPLRVESVDLTQILEFVDVDGLSGEGTLNGVLPLVVEDSRAKFVDGQLTAEGPGRISYTGKATDAAAASNENAKIAFDVLRDLRYERLSVAIDGPLDGRLDFQIYFEGTGEVSLNRAQGRVPVKYTINLDAALLELLNQANLSRNLEMQIERAVAGEP